MIRPEHFSPDALELFLIFNKNKLRFLLVGGEAVIYYGFARLTGDVDIFYDINRKNVQKLYLSLKEFWGGNIPGINNENELSEPGAIFQFGVPPNRIDLLNTITGVEFGKAWKNRIIENLKFQSRTLEIYYIGLEELIQNKRNMSRYKDLDDLKYLLKAKK